MIIPEETLIHYQMAPLEWYEENHGKCDETTEIFYKTFLSQTDYEIVRSMETGRELPEHLSEYRQFARDEISRLRG